MKYIEKVDGIWQVKRYYELYLPTVWGKFSDGAKKLIKQGRNGLAGSDTLHDAQVESVGLETIFCDGNATNDITLRITLVSGKKLTVIYKGVSRFSLHKEISMVPIPPISVHELTIDEDDEYVHEVALVSSDVWKIEFCDVEVMECLTREV